MKSPGASAEARLSLDARSLDRLKTQSRERPDEALKAAAKQFEAVFMNMLLKSMREALPQTDAFGSDSTRLYTSMLDQEMSTKLGERGGMGIADLLIKQLGDAQKGKPGALPVTGRAQTIDKLNAATAQAQPSMGAAAPQSFVDRLLPQARNAERSTGIPAEFILGQAALESGWGQREIRRADGANSFNLFGIKASPGWNGATVDVMTTEYTNGVPRKTVEKFRAYASYQQAFEDYGRLIAGSPRYANALHSGGKVERFAQGLQQGGYATDPRYAEKLTRVINHTIALARGGSGSV